MVKGKANELAESRIMQISNYLKDNPSIKFTYGILVDELGIPRTYICKHKNELLESSEHIKTFADRFGRTGGFYWEEKEPEKKPEKKEDKFGPDKNHEGYSDPTVFKALHNSGKALAGEIWDYELPRGEKTNVLVINSNKRIVQILFLSDNEDAIQKTMEHPVKLEVGRKAYFYDPMLVQSRKQWYLRNKICTLDIDIFNEVRGNVMKTMGMPDRVVTIEKEVPVEKIVEVPVEKVVEKIVEVKTPVIPDDDNLDTLKSIELAKLRTEVEIYKNFCDSFMDIMRGSAGLMKGGE